MAPSPFRSTAVVCSIVTASLGFGLLTPTTATALPAATSAPSAPSAVETPIDSIPVDSRIPAAMVVSVQDTAAGSRAVMGYAGSDHVYLLDGDEIVNAWLGGEGLFMLFAPDKYRDRGLDVVRVHIALDGSKTRTERAPLPWTLQVDGLEEKNRFTPGTKQFSGTASAGATVTATDSDGTTLFRADVRSNARSVSGTWNAAAELSAVRHTVTFTQTLPDGRSSVISDVQFLRETGDTPATPDVRPSERRLDGDFTLWGDVDGGTTAVEVRDEHGTAVGDTRLTQDDGFVATVPQEFLGKTLDVVALGADGSESPASAVELTPLPSDEDVEVPAVKETVVHPNGRVQVVGERQRTAGIQVLDGDRVVAHFQQQMSGWSFTLGPEETGKQLDLVTLDFDGQRYVSTSERVPLPRLLAVDGLAEENTYTPGTRKFVGSAEAGATVVAEDEDGTELFRTEAKQTRSGVAEWSADADLTSKDGYAITFTQTTTDGRTSVMKDVAFTPQEDGSVPAPQAEGYFPKDVAQWAGIAGTATVGAEVFVKDADGATIGSTTVTDVTGTYNVGIDPTKVGSGLQEFAVTQTVDGTTSDPVAAELDYGQNAPAFTDPAEGSTISGTDLRFTGTGTTGGTITLNGTDFTADQAIGTATVDDGRWQVENDDLDLPTGNYQFWAAQRTRGGKVAYVGLNVRVESASPSAEGYFPEDVAQWAGIAGISTQGADVVARDAAGNEVGRTHVDDERGFYNIGIDPSKVGYGEQRLAVTQVHGGVESRPVEVVLDYGTNTPTFTGPADGGRASSDDLVFTGTGDTGGRVALLGVGGDAVPTIGSAEVRDGVWTIANELELPDGAYQFWAHQRTKGGKIANTGINVQLESNR